MTLLPAIDANGSHVVIGDTVRSVYPLADCGGRVESVDGVMLRVTIKYRLGVYIESPVKWETWFCQAKDVEVCR